VHFTLLEALIGAPMKGPGWPVAKGAIAHPCVVWFCSPSSLFPQAANRRMPGQISARPLALSQRGARRIANGVCLLAVPMASSTL